MATALTRQPVSLKLLSSGFLALWCLVAAFPILWIAVMSVKSPVDAFDDRFWNVVTGPVTLANGSGVSVLGIALYLAACWGMVRLVARQMPSLIGQIPPRRRWIGWVIGAVVVTLGAVMVLFVLLPSLLAVLNPLAGPLGRDVFGFTTEHYRTVWVERGFLGNFQNSMIVTCGVVLVSLTVGTLAGYGLARSGSTLAFWILIIALVFRRCRIRCWSQATCRCSSTPPKSCAPSSGMRHRRSMASRWR